MNSISKLVAREIKDNSNMKFACVVLLAVVAVAVAVPNPGGYGSHGHDEHGAGYGDHGKFDQPRCE